MTDKRFTFHHDVDGIDYIQDESNGLCLPTSQLLCSLLNELHEEVIELNNECAKYLSDKIKDYEQFKECADKCKELHEENEQLKKEVEMLRNGLKAYDEALPLYLDCEDIMHFNSSELFEFKMEQMDFYKKYPNRVHYK